MLHDPNLTPTLSQLIRMNETINELTNVRDTIERVHWTTCFDEWKVGRYWHSDKRDLWIQDKFERKELRLGRVPSAENAAGIGTNIRKLLQSMRLEIKWS